jgi:hypothetical protein
MAAEKPDAVALLKADHRKVEELFEKFKNAESESEALVLEICTELSVHAMLEEEIFYPACQKALMRPTSSAKHMSSTMGPRF